MSGKDNVGTSGGVAIDKTEGSGYDDCSSFDTLNVAIRWPRTTLALPQAGHAGAALHSSVLRRFQALNVRGLVKLECDCASQFNFSSAFQHLT